MSWCSLMFEDRQEGRWTAPPPPIYPSKGGKGKPQTNLVILDPTTELWQIHNVYNHTRQMSFGVRIMRANGWTGPWLLTLNMYLLLHVAHKTVQPCSNRFRSAPCTTLTIDWVTFFAGGFGFGRPLWFDLVAMSMCLREVGRYKWHSLFSVLRVYGNWVCPPNSPFDRFLNRCPISRQTPGKLCPDLWLHVSFGRKQQLLQKPFKGFGQPQWIQFTMP